MLGSCCSTGRLWLNIRKAIAYSTLFPAAPSHTYTVCLSMPPAIIMVFKLYTVIKSITGNPSDKNPQLHTHKWHQIVIGLVQISFYPRTRNEFPPCWPCCHSFSLTLLLSSSAVPQLPRLVPSHTEPSIVDTSPRQSRHSMIRSNSELFLLLLPC